jgi:hypothetical protein
MDPKTLVTTRQSLHGLAESVLAGPQYARSEDIRLRVTATGFATVTEPHLQIEADALVAPSRRLPLVGSITELAVLAGVEPRALRDVYADGPTIGVNEELAVDREAAGVILAAFERGDAALRLFAPAEEPVLWPEHFDVGITVDEVNYGVSPGDAGTAEPYAYVSPWKARTGGFWNADFGASRLMRDLPTEHDVLAFFTNGASHVAEESVVG